MRPLVLLFLATLLFGGRAASAQDPLQGRVDAATLAAVGPVLQAAARDSLPMDALRSKVLEGAAKGVAPERIRAATEQLAGDLRGARRFLRDELPSVRLHDGEVSAAAMTIRNGVAPEGVAGLWAVRRGEGSLEIPIVVMGEIVRRGIPAEEAADLMRHVVSTGVAMEVAAQIPGRFDGMAMRGRPPGEALRGALESLRIPPPPRRGPGR